MDPEQTFLRVHARLSAMVLRVLRPRIRRGLEYLHFVVALALFCSLVVMHTNFVQQPGCSGELSKAKIREGDLVHIKISSAGLWSQQVDGSNVIEMYEQKNFAETLQIRNVDGDGLPLLSSKYWLNWIVSGARKSKWNKWKNDKEVVEPQMEYSVDASELKPIAHEAEARVDSDMSNVDYRLSAKELVKAVVSRLSTKCNRLFSFPWGNGVQGFFKLQKPAGPDILALFCKWSPLFQLKNLQLLMVEWLEKKSRSFEPTYLYTAEKGYFWLSEDAKLQHDIRTVNVTIPAQHTCFGNRWQQLLINSFIGYDTILMNSLLSFPGQGYLYNFQTREIYDLSHTHEQTEGSNKFEDYFVAKCGVLIMSLFVFFTTTMSVSFTLRETQSRMLKFTVQLQHHARHRLPTFQLIFIHVIESLVFVPIMIGTLFFLFEFYDDQLLAFMVLILVWLCELFTLISVRTPLSIQFFPRFFLLFFLVFHIYFFSYTYGFSYLAFATTAAFMYHLILYFWNRFEVPALERYMWNRQQPGIHITSSILTSTVHIARLNMRNSPPRGSEFSFGSVPEAPPSTNVAGSGLQPPSPPMNTSVEHAQPNSTTTDITPNANSLNPLSSLLLGILGGIPDSHVSFFSMFRDMRDPGQVYGAPQQQEQQQISRNWWSWRTS